MKVVEIGELEFASTGNMELDELLIALPVRPYPKEFCQSRDTTVITTCRGRVVEGLIPLEIARGQNVREVRVENVRVSDELMLHKQWQNLLANSLNHTKRIQEHVLSHIFCRKHDFCWFEKRGLIIDGRPITQAYIADLTNLKTQTFNAQLKKFR